MLLAFTTCICIAVAKKIVFIEKSPKNTNLFQESIEYQRLSFQFIVLDFFSLLRSLSMFLCEQKLDFLKMAPPPNVFFFLNQKIFHNERKCL